MGPPGNRRQCDGEGFRSPLAAQRMNWQGNGDWLGSWSSETCPGSRGLLRAVAACRMALTPSLGSPIHRGGARSGMEHPQPLGLLGKVTETVSQRRKRRTEKRERTGRETRKRSPQQQDEDHPDSRSSSSHSFGILLAPLPINLILSAFSRVSTSPVLNVKGGKEHENSITFAIIRGPAGYWQMPFHL